MLLVLKVDNLVHSATRILRLIQRKTNHNRHVQTKRRTHYSKHIRLISIHINEDFDMSEATTFGSPPNTCQQTQGQPLSHYRVAKSGIWPKKLIHEGE